MHRLTGLAMIWLGLLALMMAPLPAAGNSPLAPQAETYTVNHNGSDPDLTPDGLCVTVTGHCTLRAAIDEANQDGVDSTIRFSQQFKDAGHIRDSNLRLTEAGTTIDASDRWDAGPDMSGVEIASTSTILTITGGQCTVRGIHFIGSGLGIEVTGAGGNYIGGNGEGYRNVFTNNGISLFLGSGYHQIINNYFGTLDGAHAQGAGTIRVHIDHNTIANNLILGLSTGTGIHVHLGNDNTIFGNRIGLGLGESDPDPLQTGIHIQTADRNTIGPDNLIAGSTIQGIRVENAVDTFITGNTIGNESPGDGSLGNSTGIWIGNHAKGTLIKDNQIHDNDGWGVSADKADLTLTGNSITGSYYDGLFLTGGSGQIGGALADEPNILSGNGRDGIRLDGSDGVSISGNYIGLAPNGIDDMGNGGNGITLLNSASSNTIGGDQPGEGNWIAWNGNDGIHLTGAGTQLNFVWGNTLGAPVDWSAPAPNTLSGIHIREGAGANFVGGLGPGMANTILASGLCGLWLASSDTNAVLANRIGTDGAGHNWGNTVTGIYVNGADNTLGSNEIAYSGGLGDGPGVYVTGVGATGNALIANSIHSNIGAGISLASGGNGELAAPKLTAASCEGPVTGTTCPGCSVEIFSDASDEGRVYEGMVDADATSGAFSWTGQVNGPNVTATTSDAGNNTSPFSAPLAVGVCNTPPTATFTVEPGTGTVATTFSFDASACTDKEDAASALEVCWDWQNDGACDTAWQTAKTASHKYDQPGTYSVRLSVRDSQGLENAITQQVSVSEATQYIYSFLPLIVKP